MKKLAILVPAVALIFACSTNTELQAGQWEMTVKATDVQVPGATPEQAQQMKQAMAGQQQTMSRCMSAAEAANPGASLGNPGGNAQGCTFTKQTFAGGTIDIAGSCPSPAGGQAQISSTGTYTADTINMTFNAEMQVMGKQVRATSTLTGRRTGDCAGG